MGIFQPAMLVYQMVIFVDRICFLKPTRNRMVCCCTIFVTLALQRGSALPAYWCESWWGNLGRGGGNSAAISWNQVIYFFYICIYSNHPWPFLWELMSYLWPCQATPTPQPRIPRVLVLTEFSHCPHCGNLYMADSIFCRQCGRRRDWDESGTDILGHVCFLRWKQRWQRLWRNKDTKD